MLYINGRAKTDHSFSRLLIYEVKPFAVAGLAIYVSKMRELGAYGKCATLILLGCSVAIVYMRARSRGAIK